MIKGTDKLSEFPNKFNELEEQVKSLNKNTKGIKVATWITAISTAILSVVGIISIIKNL